MHTVNVSRSHEVLQSLQQKLLLIALFRLDLFVQRRDRFLSLFVFGRESSKCARV